MSASCFFIQDPTDLLFPCFWGIFTWKLNIICAGRKLIPKPFLSFLDRHVGSALSGYWILPCQATLAIQPVEGTNERRRDSTWLSILNPGLLFISELSNQPFDVFLIYICAKLGVTMAPVRTVGRSKNLDHFFTCSFSIYIYICCPPPLLQFHRPKP